MAAVSALAQERPFSAEVHVTAIELTAEVVDATGKVPSDLKPSDFVVIEDGVERAVTAVELFDLPEAAAAAPRPAGTPAPRATTEPARDWRLVVYVDLELSNRATIRDALNALAREAERLVALGVVEVVVANPNPKRVAATRDAKVLADAFAQVARITPQDRLARVRRDFMDQYRSFGAKAAATATRSNGPRANDIVPLNAPDPGLGGGGTKLDMNRVRPYAEQESALVANLYGRLLRWTSRYPRRSPSGLMLVSDGFMLDPVDFYGEGTFDAREAARIRAGLSKRAAEAHEVVLRELASAGWTFFGMRGGATASFGGDVSDHQRFGKATGNMSANVVVAASAAPLYALAEATGGSVEVDPRRFGTAIDRLRNRVRLTYQVPRPADTVSRRIEVRARRAGLNVNAPKWASSTSSNTSAAARGLALLRGADDRGELPVKVDAKIDADRHAGVNGSLAIRASFEPLDALLAQLDGTSVRVTLVAAAENQPAVATHQLLRNVNLSKSRELSVLSPLHMKSGARVAVVIEELSTGVWGATVVTVN
ncbi:MAG TPA: hypothetical protein VF698_13005 [Thermoanaerobaculia bacterium]